MDFHNQTSHALDREAAALDPVLLEALEAKPAVAIPADFAARMAKLSQSQPVLRPRRNTSYGQIAAWASLLVLAVAILVISPATLSADPLNLTPMLLLEAILVTQLVALALWLGTRGFPGTR